MRLGTDTVIGPVLLASPWYRPTVGGVVEVVDRLLRTLTQAGVDTHLMVCDSAPVPGRLETHANVPHVWHLQIPAYVFDHCNLKSFLSTGWRGKTAFWCLWNFVRHYRIRTVVLTYPYAYGWPFLLLRYLTDIRLVTSLHGNDVIHSADDSPLAQWLLRRILLDSHALIVCASHLAQKAQELCPQKALPLRLIPNCVDIHHFTPPPPEQQSAARPFSLLHVSNFAQKKRTLDIVEAFALADLPPDSRLTMVGSGPTFEETVRLARQLGVAQRVHFPGAQRDIRSYLWQADGFVLASESEGDPLVLLEAMACGVPWLSTAWGAAALLPPGECGLVIPSHAPRQLAAAMSLLYKDPQLRHAMSQHSRYRAEQEFGEQWYVEKHLQVLHEVEQHGTLPSLS